MFKKLRHRLARNLLYDHEISKCGWERLIDFGPTSRAHVKWIGPPENVLIIGAAVGLCVDETGVSTDMSRVNSKT
jgi:hypothetical protein